ncbi:MAG: glycine cleavage system aminomethyltransferase GcvT [Candidatus Odinarchaeota archaeon]|nr:glycine cleavage system aminomethyltransferase GcvT [Candidatus Odinarchaeota archaeon]
MARKTHFYDWHKERARMTEFAGYDMPVWYTRVEKEHITVRKNVGIFDVTHMGRFIVNGPEATKFLDYMVSRDLKKAYSGQALYSVLLNKHGGIIDDLIVYKKSETDYFVVVNASNKEKDFNWFKSHIKDFDAEIKDISDNTPMLAIQGPKTADLFRKIIGSKVDEIPKFNFAEVDDFLGTKVIMARTGYTGEDGFEVSFLDIPMSNSAEAIEILEKLLELGKDLGIAPCGLGARDSLRLEAGMVLYGNDMDENTTPLEARIKYALNLDKENFIGLDALKKQLEEGIKRIRIGFIMEEKGIPRHHQEIFTESKEKLGTVSSGGYSPLIKNGIGMGYVPTEHKKDNFVLINIRGRFKKAKVVSPRRMLRELKKIRIEL